MKTECQHCWGNCILGLLILYTRGKLKRIVWLKNQQGKGHLIGITKNEHVIHFHTLHKKERFAPYWFWGRLRGCRCSMKNRVFGHRVYLGEL